MSVNIVAVLERLKDTFMQKISDTFDEVIEAIEDGEMGSDDGMDSVSDEGYVDPDVLEARRIQRGM